MSKRNQGYDWLAKLLIIGDSGVGKTNILLRFCENNFLTSHLTTIGIDFKIKTIEVDGKKIRMQIWDTAGQQRFKTITQTYYKGAMGIIMTYAVNDRQTFQSLENWLKQIKMHASQNVIKVLLGNKSDCADREISYEEGKKLAESYGVQFFQTSAKQDRNIKEAFYFLAREIKEKVLVESRVVSGGSISGGTKIGATSKEKQPKKNCC